VVEPRPAWVDGVQGRRRQEQAAKRERISSPAERRRLRGFVFLVHPSAVANHNEQDTRRFGERRKKEAKGRERGSWIASELERESQGETGGEGRGRSWCIEKTRRQEAAMLTEAGHRVEYDFWGKRGKESTQSLLTRRGRVVGIIVDHRDETRCGTRKKGGRRRRG
jgi:hypothetical protein